jgi:hypothetical protein
MTMGVIAIGGQRVSPPPAAAFKRAEYGWLGFKKPLSWSEMEQSLEALKHLGRLDVRFATSDPVKI